MIPRSASFYDPSAPAVLGEEQIDFDDTWGDLYSKPVADVDEFTAVARLLRSFGLSTLSTGFDREPGDEGEELWESTTRRNDADESLRREDAPMTAESVGRPDAAPRAFEDASRLETRVEPVRAAEASHGDKVERQRAAQNAERANEAPIAAESQRDISAHSSESLQGSKRAGPIHPAGTFRGEAVAQPIATQDTEHTGALGDAESIRSAELLQGDQTERQRGTQSAERANDAPTTAETAEPADGSGIRRERSSLDEARPQTHVEGSQREISAHSVESLQGSNRAGSIRPPGTVRGDDVAPPQAHVEGPLHETSLRTFESLRGSDGAELIRSAESLEGDKAEWQRTAKYAEHPSASEDAMLQQARHDESLRDVSHRSFESLRGGDGAESIRAAETSQGERVELPRATPSPERVSASEDSVSSPQTHVEGPSREISARTFVSLRGSDGAESIRSAELSQSDGAERTRAARSANGEGTSEDAMLSQVRHDESLRDVSHRSFESLRGSDRAESNRSAELSQSDTAERPRGTQSAERVSASEDAVSSPQTHVEGPLPEASPRTFESLRGGDGAEPTRAAKSVHSEKIDQPRDAHDAERANMLEDATSPQIRHDESPRDVSSRAFESLRDSDGAESNRSAELSQSDTAERPRGTQSAERVSASEDAVSSPQTHVEGPLREASPRTFESLRGGDGAEPTRAAKSLHSEKVDQPRDAHDAERANTLEDATRPQSGHDESLRDVSHRSFESLRGSDRAESNRSAELSQSDTAERPRGTQSAERASASQHAVSSPQAYVEGPSREISARTFASLRGSDGAESIRAAEPVQSDKAERPRATRSAEREGTSEDAMPPQVRHDESPRGVSHHSFESLRGSDSAESIRSAEPVQGDIKPASQVLVTAGTAESQDTAPLPSDRESQHRISQRSVGPPQGNDDAVSTHAAPADAGILKQAEVQSLASTSEMQRGTSQRSFESLRGGDGAEPTRAAKSVHSEKVDQPRDAHDAERANTLEDATRPQIRHDESPRDVSSRAFESLRDSDGAEAIRAAELSQGDKLERPRATRSAERVSVSEDAVSSPQTHVEDLLREASPRTFESLRGGDGVESIRSAELLQGDEIERRLIAQNAERAGLRLFESLRSGDGAEPTRAAQLAHSEKVDRQRNMQHAERASALEGAVRPQVEREAPRTAESLRRTNRVESIRAVEHAASSEDAVSPRTEFDAPPQDVSPRSFESLRGIAVRGESPDSAAEVLQASENVEPADASRVARTRASENVGNSQARSDVSARDTSPRTTESLRGVNGVQSIRAVDPLQANKTEQQHIALDAERTGSSADAVSPQTVFDEPLRDLSPRSLESLRGSDGVESVRASKQLQSDNGDRIEQQDIVPDAERAGSSADAERSQTNSDGPPRSDTGSRSFESLRGRDGAESIRAADAVRGESRGSAGGVPRASENVESADASPIARNDVSPRDISPVAFEALRGSDGAESIREAEPLLGDNIERRHIGNDAEVERSARDTSPRSFESLRGVSGVESLRAAERLQGDSGDKIERQHIERQHIVRAAERAGSSEDAARSQMHPYGPQSRDTSPRSLESLRGSDGVESTSEMQPKAEIVDPAEAAHVASSRASLRDDAEPVRGAGQSSAERIERQRAGQDAERASELDDAIHARVHRDGPPRDIARTFESLRGTNRIDSIRAADTLRDESLASRSETLLTTDTAESDAQTYADESRRSLSQRSFESLRGSSSAEPIHAASVEQTYAPEVTAHRQVQRQPTSEARTTAAHDVGQRGFESLRDNGSVGTIKPTAATGARGVPPMLSPGPHSIGASLVPDASARDAAPLPKVISKAALRRPQPAPETRDASPGIEVHIDRIEIAQPPSEPRKRARRPMPKMTLDRYAERRQ